MYYVKNVRQKRFNVFTLLGASYFGFVHLYTFPATSTLAPTVGLRYVLSKNRAHKKAY